MSSFELLPFHKGFSNNKYSFIDLENMTFFQAFSLMATKLRTAFSSGYCLPSNTHPHVKML